MLEQIDFTESIRNAQINHGIDSFRMQEDDLSIRETDFKAQTSKVLMIDISHSMILYGEDRITPAKKVAMALSELIKTRYPKGRVPSPSRACQAFTKTSRQPTSRF